MAIGNTKWRPSMIENHCYDLLDDYILGVDTYEYTAVDVISTYLSECSNIQWEIFCVAWPDMTGGSCSVAFVEDGILHTFGFDYKKV